jgi:hypothetical protein
MICSDNVAIAERQDALASMLKKLQTFDAPNYILNAFEECLSEHLRCPASNSFCDIQEHQLSQQQQRTLKTATQHQNIIGWDNYLRGYVSIHWCNQTTEMKTRRSKVKWFDRLTDTALSLITTIWKKRNEMVHGKTILEQRQKAREAVLEKVRIIYRENPKLAPRYAAIYEVPLERRLKRSTNTLTTWIDRIHHQRKVSQILFSTLPPGQLTIAEAFRRHVAKTKYPP